MQNLSYTQAVLMGIIKADEVDPHSDFAPYCEHDKWPTAASPLYWCACSGEPDPRPVVQIKRRVYEVSMPQPNGIGRGFVDFDDREEAWDFFRKLQDEGHVDIRIWATVQ